MTSRLPLVAALALLAGCASVVRGTSEKVTVTAEPPDSAIRTSLGHSCPASPCVVEVSRKTEFTAFAEKEGFKPGSIYVGTAMSGGGAAGMAGNVVLGGVIGIGVDAATGATLDHKPNPANIVLVPADSPGESTKAVVPEKKPAQRPASARTS